MTYEVAITTNRIDVVPNVPEIKGKRYNTIANALTYTATASPAYANRFKIMFSGYNTEDFTMQSWVAICGNCSTDVLDGEITIATAWGANAWEEIIIENCTLGYNQGCVMADSSYGIVLRNCNVGWNQNGSKGILVMEKCHIFNAYLRPFDAIYMYDCVCVPNSGDSCQFIATVFECHRCSFKSTDVDFITDAVFYDCDFDQNVAFNDFSTDAWFLYNCSTANNVTIANTSTVRIYGGTHEGTWTVNSGCNLYTYGVPEITVTGAGNWVNEGDVYDNGTSGLSATNMQAAMDEVVTMIGGQNEFIELTDTPGSYTTANAIYTTNGTPDAVIETTVVLTEAANTFNITKGTASLDIAVGAALDVDANLSVEAASAVNQDLTTDATPEFDGLNLDGDLTFRDPGTSANSHKLLLIADNSGTPQTSSLVTAYGADPYLRISAPNDSGTETGVLDIHDTSVVCVSDNTVDIGASDANRPKDIYAAGTVTAGSSTNNVAISATGISLSGTGKVLKKILLTTGDMHPNTAQYWRVAHCPMYRFDDTTSEEVDVSFPLPNDIDLTVNPIIRLHVCPYEAQTSGSNFVFDLDCKYIASTESIESADAENPTSGAITVSNTTRIYTTGDVTLNASLMASGDLIAIGIVRDTATDDRNGDACLICAEFIYTSDKIGG